MSRRPTIIIHFKTIIEGKNVVEHHNDMKQYLQKRYLRKIFKNQQDKSLFNNVCPLKCISCHARILDICHSYLIKVSTFLCSAKDYSLVEQYH